MATDLKQAIQNAKDNVKQRQADALENVKKAVETKTQVSQSNSQIKK